PSTWRRRATTRAPATSKSGHVATAAPWPPSRPPSRRTRPSSGWPREDSTARTGPGKAWRRRVGERYALLNPDHSLRHTDDPIEWGRAFNDSEARRVGRDEVGG